MSMIETEISDNVGLIRLNSPAKLNAISKSMVSGIDAALDEFDGKIRALVVTGTGRSFCSGADLGGSMREEGDQGGEARPRDFGAPLETHINPLMLRLRALPYPWITLVRGAAAGVGCSLALAADLIVASDTAYFLQAFARIGLVPDGGSSFLLTRAAGRARASEMMLLGDRIPAAQALEWGLVNRVVIDATLEVVGMELARRLAGGPTASLALTRRLIWGSLETDFKGALAAERECQREVGRFDDPYEGIAAFNDKRPAQFKGM